MVDMKTAATAIVALGLVCTAPAVVLYDKLKQIYNSGNGCWDGGAGDFGKNYGLQVGQRVAAVAGGETITQVTGAYLMFTKTPDIQSGLVQVFDLLGDTVGGLVGSYQGVITWTTSGQYDGDIVIYVTAQTSIGGLKAGDDYLVVLQPHGLNWGYIARDANGAHGTFLRDYSSFGYQGGYGTTDWVEAGAYGYGSGDASMLVVATPEQSSLVYLATLSGLFIVARGRVVRLVGKATSI